jgi:hypothetical protein
MGDADISGYGQIGFTANQRFDPAAVFLEDEWCVVGARAADNDNFEI